MRKEVATLRERGPDMRGAGFDFCLTGFRQYVDLPEEVDECTLVATDVLTPDSFGIKQPQMEGWPPQARSELTRVRNTPILFCTQYKLAKLYAKGYRAVHIEYEG